MSLAYIKLFFSIKTDFEALDDAEFRRLLLGALSYAETHIEPDFSGNEKYLWPMFRGQIDRDQQSYEDTSQARKNAANKRWQHQSTSLKTKENANVCNSMQMHANDAKTKNKTMTKKEEKDFSLFWAAYPKKKCKGDAEKIWRSLKPPIDDVLNAIEKQRKSADWIKDNGQYIPYPTKWLRGKCWEDEVDQGMLHGHVHVNASDPDSYVNSKNEIDELNRYD